MHSYIDGREAYVSGIQFIFCGIAAFGPSIFMSATMKAVLDL